MAGCIFAFCASRQAHLEHVNLLQFGWLPMALLCLHKAVSRGRTSDFLLFALFTERSQRAFELLSKTRVVRVPPQEAR